MTRVATADPLDLRTRVERLGFRGVLDYWHELADEPVLQRIIDIEEQDRSQRGLERRLRNAKLGRFKPMADFEWAWPQNLDSGLVEELFQLKFIDQAANVILVGANGVGKTMIAKNLAYQAVLEGHTARFITASELLNDLAAQETGTALTRKLRQYSHWKILVIVPISSVV